MLHCTILSTVGILNALGFFLMLFSRYLGELYKSRQGEGSYKGKRRLLWSIKSSLAEFNEEYEHITEQLQLMSLYLLAYALVED